MMNSLTDKDKVLQFQLENKSKYLVDNFERKTGLSLQEFNINPNLDTKTKLGLIINVIINRLNEEKSKGINADYNYVDKLQDAFDYLTYL